jgi:hypothetical protein
MDPVTATVVSAIVAGATAIGNGFATEAIKDGYKLLKGWILGRYSSAAPIVDMVEKDPTKSEPEQLVLAKQLGGASSDEKLKELAQKLIAAIQETRETPQASALLDFGSLDAAGKFEMDHIKVLNTALLVRGHAHFASDAKFSDMSQGQPPEPPKKTKLGLAPHRRIALADRDWRQLHRARHNHPIRAGIDAGQLPVQCPTFLGCVSWQWRCPHPFRRTACRIG